MFLVAHDYFCLRCCAATLSKQCMMNQIVVLESYKRSGLFLLKSSSKPTNQLFDSYKNLQSRYPPKWCSPSFPSSLPPPWLLLPLLTLETLNPTTRKDLALAAWVLRCAVRTSFYPPPYFIKLIHIFFLFSVLRQRHTSSYCWRRNNCFEPAEQHRS